MIATASSASGLPFEIWRAASRPLNAWCTINNSFGPACLEPSIYQHVVAGESLEDAYVGEYTSY